MREHFIEGGFGMWPILLLGLGAMGLGLRYAFTGDARLRGCLEALARSILYFALMGFVTGLVATGDFLAAHADLPRTETLLTGVKESTNDLALGFTFLALVHLQLAVGRRREDDRVA